MISYMYYFLDSGGQIRGAAARAFASRDEALDQARLELTHHHAVEIWSEGCQVALVRRAADARADQAA